MNKEINIMIGMVYDNKESYSPEDLATILNLKYSTGVYPYIKRLLDKDFIKKVGKGNYALNERHNKVKDIQFMINLFGKNAGILFTQNTKEILTKFAKNPLLRKTELPQNKLKTIKDIAKKTKIIFPLKEKGKDEHYFIVCWEEPTLRILDFFDIKLQFDTEDFKHSVVKHYSQTKNTNSPIDEENQRKLKKLNVETYIAGREFILDKLKETSFSFLSIIKSITEKKNKCFSNNPFELTSKITDWKMRYIYNTDKIEGNPLSMQEVKTILTVGSLSVEQDSKAILETVNSRTALDNIFETSNELTEDFIKRLHLATQNNLDDEAGEYKEKENCITDSDGVLIDTTTPVQFVGKRMESLIEWYNKNKEILHPLVLATIVHNQFVYIHPFNDGNGRVARLIFNFILIKNGFFPIIFFNDDKSKYYNYLRSSKNGDIRSFISYCLNLYRTQLDEF